MVVAHTDLVTAQRESAMIPSPCQRPSTEQQKQIHTRKTNMTPENGPLEKEIHIGNPSFWMSIYTLIFQACRVLKRIVAMKYPALHSDDFERRNLTTPSEVLFLCRNTSLWRPAPKVLESLLGLDKKQSRYC